MQRAVPLALLRLRAGLSSGWNLAGQLAAAPGPATVGAGDTASRQLGHALLDQLWASSVWLRRPVGNAASREATNKATAGDLGASSDSARAAQTLAKPRRRRKKKEEAEQGTVVAAAATVQQHDAAVGTAEKAAVALEQSASGYVVAAAQLEGSRLGLSARVLEDDAHPIRDRHLSPAAWFVLTHLQGAGHECYVVGGTVRDILVGGTPKDYDILTSAEPHQVRKLFNRCVVVGRSFPVCHVHTNNTIIEVTSFATNTDATTIPADASSYLLGRHKHPKPGTSATKGKKRESEAVTWAAARRDNASRRDFTVNGLLYDPFSRTLYDYVDGTADCDARLLRTISPPLESFQQDPARMLRGVRMAARAGLEIDAATAEALSELAPRLAGLPHGRLQMELSSLMGYGAASCSTRLLWRFGMLDQLLPRHALYLKSRRMPRQPGPRRRRNDMLFDLLSALDERVSPQSPVDPAVWTALLAAPLVAQAWQSLVRQRQSEGARQSSGSTSIISASPAGEASSSGLQDEQGEEELPLLQNEAGWRQAKPDVQPTGESGSAAEGSSSTEVESSSDSEDEETPTSRALAAYAGVVEGVVDSLLQPLDVALCRRLGLDVSALLATRPPLSRRQAALLRQEANIDSQAAAASSPTTVVIPPILPRGALEKAGALLMADARLRGRELPGEQGQQGQQHRHKRMKRLNADERLVLSILRDPRFKFAQLTSLAQLVTAD